MHRVIPVPSVVLLVCFALAAPVAAEEWNWPTDFTEASSEALEALNGDLYTSGERLDPGVPVEDVHWTNAGVDVHLKRGTIWRERHDGEGASGAVFVGEAAITFTPGTERAKADLAMLFGEPIVDAIPASNLYFFVTGDDDVLAQIGLDADGDREFEAWAEYRLAKKAMRQMGTRLMETWIDRAHRAKGSAYVLFDAEPLRTGNSPEAFLLYANEPHVEKNVRLQVFGSNSYLQYADYAYNFFTLTAFSDRETPWVAPWDVVKYDLDVVSTGTTGRVEQSGVIELTPRVPTRVMDFAFTQRLPVSRLVMEGSGEALEFAQWEDVPNRAVFFDPALLVRLDEPLEVGKTYRVGYEAAGDLFDTNGPFRVLAEEDIWHPRLDDPDGALYELRTVMPKNDRAVAVGELVSDEVKDGKRHSHFRSTRPHHSSTFYTGVYTTKKGKADDIQVEVYQYRDIPNADADVKWTLQEVSNAVQVYNRILMPLDIEQLRVAATPTGHGRGFEGLIIMSFAGVGDSLGSAGDTFRAHEVAHMWWGNIVQPVSWVEDRWLSESTAEYSAMEYYTIRYDPQKARTQIKEQWYQPMTEKPKTNDKDVTGDRFDRSPLQRMALIQGGPNVYSKGPLMLHALRYLYRVQHGDDERFWLLLQDFLAKHKYGRVATSDFIAMAEEKMGGGLEWFWDQWLYGTEIPRVTWDYRVEEEGGQTKLVVEAEQADTEFVLAMPITIELKGGQAAQVPLILQGKRGKREVPLPEKPKRVSLNDNFEALVYLDRR